MKHNVLFVSEKWCDCNPSEGITNSYSVLFSTFKHSMIDVPFNIVHYDEIMLNQKIHIDGVLEKVCDKYKPNVIFFSMIMGQMKYLNPSLEIIKRLKEKGHYICFIWPDIQQAFGMNELLALDEVADLHISHACESNIKDNKKILNTWTPIDPKLYFPISNQDIPVSFIGSTRYADRQQYLQYALQKELPIAIGGGQRESKMTSEQYAQMIKKSRISINFSASPGGDHQLKGRVFESIACGSMLLESQNEITPLFFEPGKEFIQFGTMDDMVEKITYYLNHEEDRKKIAQAGLKRFQENWTAKHFWDKVFQRIENEKP